MNRITESATIRSPGLPQAILLLLGACLPIMGTVLLAPALPKVQADFANVPNVQILVPIMLTVPALVLSLLSLYAGSLIDRLGRRPLLLWSLLLYSLAGTAPSWLPGLPSIIASRAMVGLAEAGIMTACTTLVGDYWNGRQRERLLTLQTVVGSLSAVAFFTLGGAIAEHSWRAPFWLYGLGVILLVPMWLLLWEPHKPDLPTSAIGRPAREFPRRKVAVICLITTPAAIAFYVVPVHLGFYLDGQGEHSPARIGQAIGLSNLCTMVGAASYPVLARLGVSRHLAMAFSFISAGLFLLVKATDYPTIVIAASVNAVGCGMVIPTLLNWMMRTVTFEERGRGSGAFMASFFLGQFVCPLCVLSLESTTRRGLNGALDTFAWAAGAATALALTSSLCRTAAIAKAHTTP